jgi:hypothetical protein
MNGTMLIYRVAAAFSDPPRPCRIHRAADARRAAGDWLYYLVGPVIVLFGDPEWMEDVK